MDIRVFPGRAELGASASRDIAAALRDRVARAGRARVMFAAAPSQSDMIEALARAPGVDWSAVTAFHMDEYIGLDAAAPQGFGQWLRARLFGRLPFGGVHYLGTAGTAESARAYARAMDEAPLDVVCLGIGVNGHLAFNDPAVADFDDPVLVKEVELDATCRRQQVDDGCFPVIDEVPRRALTVTIPALLAGRRLFCVVPGGAKATAVRDAVTGPVAASCPASALRRHEDCTLYLDQHSAALLDRPGAGR